MDEKGESFDLAMLVGCSAGVVPEVNSIGRVVRGGSEITNK